MTLRLLQLHKRLEMSEDTLGRQSDVVLTLTSFFRQHSSVAANLVRQAPPRVPVDRAPENCCMVRMRIACRCRSYAECAGLSPYHFLRVFVRE